MSWISSCSHLALEALAGTGVVSLFDGGDFSGGESAVSGPRVEELACGDECLSDAERGFSWKRNGTFRESRSTLPSSSAAGRRSMRRRPWTQV